LQREEQFAFAQDSVHGRASRIRVQGSTFELRFSRKHRLRVRSGPHWINAIAPGPTPALTRSRKHPLSCLAETANHLANDLWAKNQLAAFLITSSKRSGAPRWCA